jgi:hypothetical protein
MWFAASQTRCRLGDRAVKLPGSRRPYWRRRLAAGGRTGADAMMTLWDLHPAEPDVVASWDTDPRTVAASWPGDDPGDDSAEALDEVYEQFYPSDGRAARELEKREQRRAREAAQFNRSAHHHDKLLASGPGDDNDFRMLFGE